MIEIPNLVVTCIIVAVLFIVAERIFPARELEQVAGWWKRVIAINSIQAGIVIFGGYTWDPFFTKTKLFSFQNELSPLVGGAAGYFVLTFIYYWWHRARHNIPFLWQWLHQVHHSPARIETITSFYKHPFEILVNTLITSATLYLILGLSVAQSTWAVFFLAVAEYCYHVNIRTPVWLGYFIQRPEMHRLHHKRGEHRYNYGDLPIWDILFGTFRNPYDQPEPCGLGQEDQLVEMILGRVVQDEA